MLEEKLNGKEKRKLNCNNHNLNVRNWKIKNCDKVKLSIKNWKIKNYSSVSGYALNYRKQNLDRVKKLDNNRHHKAKEEALEILGNKCEFCGETEFEFLTIDHVYDDGFEERKSKQHRQIWRDIITNRVDRSRYRVLCYNCNSGRAILQRHERKSISKHLVDSICKKCGNPTIARIRIDKKGYNIKNHECFVCQKKHARNLKYKILDILSKKCICCGESEEFKLTIDHVNDDGNITRKDEGTGVQLYRRILNNKIDKNRFQILCWNCNHSKHIGGGKCIHQRDR